MHDDLDLRVIEREHDADPQYRAALRQRVAAILDSSETAPRDDTAPEAATIDLAEKRLTEPERHRGRWVVRAAAVVAAAAAIVAIVVVRSGSDTLAPADEPVPATDPRVDEPVPATDPRVDEPVPAFETAADPPMDFTEIAPGEMVQLPDWPLSARVYPTMVWTGTEMIVWGGFGDDDRAGDGAAFDLADGTWRVIAQAPISPRSETAAAWTGTEMLLWGGSIADEVNARDGAAYNPSTDTWRLLPSAPDGVGVAGMVARMVWTGNEAVVLDGNGSAAAYDPVTDSWRALAPLPSQGSFLTALWTGDSIVVADETRVMRSDLTADRWDVVDLGSPAAVVGVAGPDGRMSTFVNLPSEVGAPAQLIDDTGSPIAELPAFPGDPSMFGDQIGAYGLWVGDEAVLWISTAEFPYEPEQVWALSPSKRTWRQLDADASFPQHVHSAVVVADDMLLMWGTGGGDGRCCSTTNDGFAYHVGTTPSD